MRGIELSIHHYLVVYNLKLSTAGRTYKIAKSRATHRIKWEALVRNEIRNKYADTITSKFRVFHEQIEDIETEWGLLF